MNKSMTQHINKLQRRYPGTRRQRSYHGCGRYSVQFFDKDTGELKADINIWGPDFERRQQEGQ